MLDYIDLNHEYNIVTTDGGFNICTIEQVILDVNGNVLAILDTRGNIYNWINVVKLVKHVRAYDGKPVLPFFKSVG